MKTIRGVHVVHTERDDANRSWIENLRYSLDEFDDGGNLVEVLGRLADLDPARAAFAAAIAKHPSKRIMLCTGGRVLARSDEPPEWLTAYKMIPVVKENP
jgi:hypothetical protein